jgi:hypothetical protein
MYLFADRFDARRYADDEPIAIGLASESSDAWLYVPGSIFGRILAVGGAYRLHVLGAVMASEATVGLNPLQCQGLLDELKWVGTVLNDPLVADVIPAIQQRVAVCARSRDEQLLVVFEGWSVLGGRSS